MDVAESRLALAEWGIHLRGQRKSPATVKVYADGVNRFLDWTHAAGMEPELTPSVVNRFVVALLDGGNAAATARSRQLAVRRFSAWCAAEEIIPGDQIKGLEPPKLDSKVIEPLTEAQLKALLRACTGKDFRDRRDEAIIRLMAETGARAGETADLAVSDVDLPRGTAVIRKGKGGKGRIVGIGPQTSTAIARYLRMRGSHRLAGTAAMWLGDRGKPFTYDGLHKALKGRAVAAGIEGFHPHLLRHTAAHRWLAAGGSESGLMAQAGWTRPDMLMRYTRARGEQRAIDEAKGLNLGEL